MAARARFSIGGLMVVVVFVAADFAIVRALWDSNGPLVAVALTTLPMINLLLPALLKLRRVDDGRPFWLGFEVMGWSIVFLVALMGWFHESVFFAPINWLDDLNLFPKRTAAETAFIIGSVVLLYTTPQVLAALIGGRLAARYRVVIERRP